MNMKAVFEKYQTMIVTLSLIIVVAGIYSLFFKDANIDFARQAFVDLMKARQSVQSKIDWESFQAMGINVAEEYAKNPSEEQRMHFRRLLINGIATGFKNSGGKLNAFSNWRIFSKDTGNITVAVDNAVYHKTLLLSITQGPPKKLVSIQWAENQ